ncbi:hypothetical protein GUITHDRAFT_137526 [Guillardia theta CCMP2712]|uniref:Uncharacterized protein n=1 Tax=Guillardia theta (strain CCMP2712) TaxID=905079 RepID=L1JGY4_GUITC|nr:hypothetical protein GUITHDRAFT_137526 [Guillardia theta CCMP2712]EKX47345.1 hypothetical protein GUITHDRAFT_137526 [Guillardia theta CCMP2712]|eukprot:XP_005834325.1 hypothetical protein GUITHDRAFT_137526 [Guillardia theta CCMP2712]
MVREIPESEGKTRDEYEKSLHDTLNEEEIFAPARPFGSASDSKNKQIVNKDTNAKMNWTMYSREELLAIGKQESVCRRPPDIPELFRRDAPGNVAEKAKMERNVRKRDERERERERRDRGGRGIRMPINHGAGLLSHPEPRGRGGLSHEERHKMMMEEVERERCALAAQRNREKAAMATNPGLVDDAIISMSGTEAPMVDPLMMREVPVNQQFADDDDVFDLKNLVGPALSDISDDAAPLVGTNIPVPPEASPSKFGASRAGRWFASPAERQGNQPMAQEKDGKMNSILGGALPLTFNSDPLLSPQPAPSSHTAPFMPLNSAFMDPVTSSFQSLPNMPPQPPLLSSFQATDLSMLERQQFESANKSGGYEPPLQPPPPQTPSPARAEKPSAPPNLASPGIPFARPGNSILSKLLGANNPAGLSASPLPPLPNVPSTTLSVEDIEKQLMNASSKQDGGGGGRGGGAGGVLPNVPISPATTAGAFDAKSFFQLYENPVNRLALDEGGNLKISIPIPIPIPIPILILIPISIPIPIQSVPRIHQDESSRVKCRITLMLRASSCSSSISLPYLSFPLHPIPVSCADSLQMATGKPKA